MNDGGHETATTTETQRKHLENRIIAIRAEQKDIRRRYGATSMAGAMIGFLEKDIIEFETRLSELS
jgi:hypothetical protein